MKKNNENERGIAIIFVLLITGIILSISLVLTNIFITKLRSSNDASNSVKALYAADSGIEWWLYQEIVDPGEPKPVFSNGAAFDIEEDPVLIYPVKSIGKFGRVRRAMEISF